MIFCQQMGQKENNFYQFILLNTFSSVLSQTKRVEPSTVSPSKIFLKADVYVYVSVGICEAKHLRGQKGASYSIPLELEIKLPRVHAGNWTQVLHKNSGALNQTAISQALKIFSFLI